jgi:hypothetical protein
VELTVFYSWQADIRAAANRTLIQNALEGAATALGKSQLGVEPVIDRDTVNVPGSPDIAHTIFSKIDLAAAFVADVTIVNSGEKRPSPNPNVLVELGYAFRALGEARIILVQNDAFGLPEQLPFDIRRKRVLTYNSPADAADRSAARRSLQATLETALAAVLRMAIKDEKASAPIELVVKYKEVSISQDLHKYDLLISICNKSTRQLIDWHMDVEMPTILLPRNVKHLTQVPERSNGARTLLRFTSAAYRELFPGDSRTVTVDYLMDRERYEQRNVLFDETICVRVYVEDALVSEVERPVRDMQNF